MIESRIIGDTVARWQAELDASLETGEAPVFVLGYGAGTLGELAGPLALQWLDETRRDTRMPLAAGGGPSPFWLPALLHQRGADAPLLSPAAVVCFTAPDRATHTAALNTLDTRRLRFRRRPGGLPPGFQPLFVAGTAAGPFAAESLPLLLGSGLLGGGVFAAGGAPDAGGAPLPLPLPAAAPAPAGALSTGAPSAGSIAASAPPASAAPTGALAVVGLAPAPAGEDTPSGRDGWVAWAAVVMAVALLLIALVA